MNKELSDFAARLREAMAADGRVPRGPDSEHQSLNEGSWNSPLRDFNSLALELFALQFQNNPAYRMICRARRLTPQIIEHWTQIPAVPTASFKELELTCLPPGERTAVFHSSGTTGQKFSRHYHCPESLKIYETSLWSWFEGNVLSDLRFTIYDLRSENKSAICHRQSAIFLTPPPEQAPHSSLVHMFETVRPKIGASDSGFFGKIAADGSWTLNFDSVLAALNSLLVTRHASLLLGTAFSLVHLLDYLDEKNLRFDLPAG